MNKAETENKYKKVTIYSALLFFLVSLITNYPTPLNSYSAPNNADNINVAQPQRVLVAFATTTTLPRDNYTSTAPPAPKPNPSTAKGIAHKVMFNKYGWANETEYSCLLALWEKESNWRHTAENKSSGAYGIPQSLPGNKMATIASDWRTNPETQIIWGLQYINGRYGTACKAWEHSKQKNWY